jgi:hypothetical protein
VKADGSIATLVSGGQFYVNATLKGEQLIPVNGYSLIIPVNNTGGADNDMKLFQGQEVCAGDDCKIVWEEMDRGVEVAKWQDTGGVYSVYYAFQSKFGWTNIDKWYNDPREKTTIYVDLPNEYNNIGILLTAIIVAGRSASAFTAAIGSMKLNEEVDAMSTLGLDPVEVLVLPRVMALVFMLPILGLVADLAGLVGGALMSWIELGISPGMFRTRLVENTDVQHFLVGIVKAPFFAVIIGVIGCYQGLKVESSAESLGRLTSRSVVMAIFMVIVVDALFSILFAAVGV